MPRHPNKHIREALAYAESKGWRIEMSRGHAWAIIYCPGAERGACKKSVYSTPQNPQNHAKDIRRFVDRCRHA